MKKGKLATVLRISISPEERTNASVSRVRDVLRQVNERYADARGICIREEYELPHISVERTPL